MICGSACSTSGSFGSTGGEPGAVMAAGSTRSCSRPPGWWTQRRDRVGQATLKSCTAQPPPFIRPPRMTEPPPGWNRPPPASGSFPATPGIFGPPAAYPPSLAWVQSSGPLIWSLTSSVEYVPDR